MPSADALAATAARLQAVPRDAGARPARSSGGLRSAIGQWLAWSARLIAAHRPRDAAVADADDGGPSSSAAARSARRARLRLRNGDGLPLPVRRRTGSCSPSGTSRAATRWTARTTTCSPPRRGWPASSPSPRTTCPVDHWFRLGRTLTHAAGETALVSWSGSMFEYLMPALVMRSFPFTAARPDLPGRGAAADRLRRRARRARGASARAPTTCATGTTPTSTGPSACRTSRSSAASAGIWWSRPTPRRSRCWSNPQRALANLAALEAQGRARPVRLPRRARLHPPAARSARSPSCAPTWRTTSGCVSSR